MYDSVHKMNNTHMRQRGMDIRIIVGLEAHDGSGKSTTAVEISKLFGGSVSSQTNKSRRNAVKSTEINQ